MFFVALDIGYGDSKIAYGHSNSKIDKFFLRQDFLYTKIKNEKKSKESQAKSKKHQGRVEINRNFSQKGIMI